eukprot:TRINITY_DN8814_c0_g1_i1.p1 TRINITY_DN8814_c0_g1~~TRINITY_DN8814_c0_g1_i1.p1  ORF type:complete len:129 (+),score=0.09 TRINITY_DN8814_c0_g1_i1:19-405(+)
MIKAIHDRIQILFFATFIGSIIHFTDNYVNFDTYLMDSTTPIWVVPLYWLIMTPIGFYGWFVFKKLTHFNWYLIVYGCMAMFSFGHYFVQPMWDWDWFSNFTILCETIPATGMNMLLVYLRMFSAFRD